MAQRADQPETPAAPTQTPQQPAAPTQTPQQPAAPTSAPASPSGAPGVDATAILAQLEQERSARHAAEQRIAAFETQQQQAEQAAAEKRGEFEQVARERAAALEQAKSMLINSHLQNALLRGGVDPDLAELVLPGLRAKAKLGVNKDWQVTGDASEHIAALAAKYPAQTAAGEGASANDAQPPLHPSVQAAVESLLGQVSRPEQPEPHGDPYEAVARAMANGVKPFAPGGSN